MHTHSIFQLILPLIVFLPLFSPSPTLAKTTPPVWELVFSDDFNTDVPVGGFSDCVPYVINKQPYQVDHSRSNCNGLPTGVKEKWFAYPDGWTDRYYGTYYPSKVVSISNGMMHKKLHSELINSEWLHLIATVVPKIPNSPGAVGGMLYGRYAIKFIIHDAVPGYKIAWLLWPESNDQPRDGEVDFPEVDAFTDTSAIQAHIYASNHKSDPRGNNTSHHTQTRPVDGRWHTAITEWTPNELVFYLDGIEIGHQTNFYNIPHKPMSWRIQTQGMVWQAIEPANGAIVNIDIDWVKAWALKTSTPSSSPSPSPTFLPGDFNTDGQVDIFDYNLLVTNWNNPYTQADYTNLKKNFGK